jgi:hypothetical protein
MPLTQVAPAKGTVAAAPDSGEAVSAEARVCIVQDTGRNSMPWPSRSWPLPGLWYPASGPMGSLPTHRCHPLQRAQRLPLRPAGAPLLAAQVALARAGLPEKQRPHGERRSAAASARRTGRFRRSLLCRRASAHAAGRRCAVKRTAPVPVEFDEMVVDK